MIASIHCITYKYTNVLHVGQFPEETITVQGSSDLLLFGWRPVAFLGSCSKLVEITCSYWT